jgi:hypothetical protein
MCGEAKSSGSLDQGAQRDRVVELAFLRQRTNTKGLIDQYYRVIAELAKTRVGDLGKSNSHINESCRKKLLRLLQSLKLKDLNTDEKYGTSSKPIR